MLLQFVMNTNGVDIKVEAPSFEEDNHRLPHLFCVGAYSFFQAGTGASIGSARHNQDCDQIELLAGTREEFDLASTALKWIEQSIKEKIIK